MRTRTAAISAAFVGVFSLLASGAGAQTNEPDGLRSPERRPPARLRIYPRYRAEPDDVDPRYFPGRNAVRECNATYMQEFRPSGTVIVPHMRCHWRRG